MSSHFEIVNWSEYQHYGQRTPPWIKLHNQILDSFDLMQLDPSVRWLAVGMMLLASRTGNRIPDDERFIRNRLWLDDLSGLDELERIDFLRRVDGASDVLASGASDVLADGASSTLAAGASTRRGEERRERTEKTSSSRAREPRGMERLRALLGSASIDGAEIRGTLTWPAAIVGMYGPDGTKRGALDGFEDAEIGSILAESIVALAGEGSGRWSQPFFDSIVRRVARDRREGVAAGADGRHPLAGDRGEGFRYES